MKEKPKNWPHQIIDFLYQHYSETWTELNRFLYTALNLQKHNTTHKDKIRELLDQLEEKGYLKWIANKMDDKGNSIDAQYREIFKNITDDGLDAARVEARLTLDGLDYAIELRREKWKHRIFVIATPAGTIFALTAAAMSIANYKGCQSEPIPSKQVIITSPEVKVKEEKTPIEPTKTQYPQQVPEKKKSK